ncbi:FecR domain-containing protein [Duncaniella freteri]|uniref:FecR family protein n=1 Tax=Duncaniella freteri TaxID=2530391 RepID=UPI002558063F|nr:FecR domain-containing protein [Duncaniella freteri]
MDYDRHITRLIYLRMIGTISPSDNQRLEEWLDADQAHRRFFESLSDYDTLSEEMLMRSAVDYRRPALDMTRIIRSRRRARISRRIIRAAAILAAIIAIGTTLLFLSPVRLSTSIGDSRQHIAETPPAKSLDDFVAGSPKATVTNSTGQTISLSANESGRDGADCFITPPSPTPEELCLEVPRGGEFKIILEDSTEVWLNSESTIRYPEAFGSGERRVAVTGEVYFQVKKDPSRPFYVETDRQVVRVYGTSFNIRAYHDEPATYTTLETGSISLSQSSAPSGELFLSQGHQAILDHTSDRINMSVVDPGMVTSWRHGRFIFENQTLERIMRDLSRWYDFHYEFTDQSLSSRIFMGSIPRYSDFRTAIQVLENCGHIRFTVSPSDNKILISEE